MPASSEATAARASFTESTRTATRTRCQRRPSHSSWTLPVSSGRRQSPTRQRLKRNCPLVTHRRNLIFRRARQRDRGTERRRHRGTEGRMLSGALLLGYCVSLYHRLMRPSHWLYPARSNRTTTGFSSWLALGKASATASSTDD